MGVKVHQDGTITNSFYVDGHKVAMFADQSHLMKSVRNMLFKHSFILSPETVQKYGLPSDIVSLQPIMELAKWQATRFFKIAPHLDDSCFVEGNFSKMKVKPAQSLLSRETASAIRTLVYYHGKPKWWLTTAWFCDNAGQWSDIMSARHSKWAFSLKKEDKYLEIKQFLADFMEDVRTMKVGDSFKPIQTGIMLTNTSMVEMSEFYLREKNHETLLGSVFSTDALENTNMQIRDKNKAPTALEVLYIIRTLVASNFTKTKFNGNCEDEQSRWLTTLEEIRNLKKLETTEEEQEDIDFVEGSSGIADRSESYAFTCLLGCLFKRTICKKSFCDKCVNALVKKDDESMQFDKLLKMKEYKPGALVPANMLAYKFFSLVENTVNANPSVYRKGIVVWNRFMDKMVGVANDQFPKIPSCHIRLLLNRFMHMRSHFWAKFMNQKRKSDENLAKEQKKKIKEAAHASKSMMGYYLP